MIMYITEMVLLRTKWATTVKKLWGFSETIMLQRSNTPSFERPYVQSAILLRKAYERMVPRVLHFSAFIAIALLKPI